MSLTLLVWLLIAAFLLVKSFERPSYAVGMYMLTFFANPFFWWWGNHIQGIRWNFLAGLLLILTVLLTRSRTPLIGQSPLSTNAVRILVFIVINMMLVHVMFAVNEDSSWGWIVNRLKFILLFFLLQYSIKDEKDYRIVAMAIALGMGYIGYECTINERGSFSGGRLEGVGAAGVTSSNHLASLLITGLPLATTFIFNTASRWKKGVIVLFGALTLNVVLMCNSRGAFLGLLAGGAIFLLMASGPARRQSMRLAAVAALGTFILLGDPEITERFLSTFDSEARQQDASTRGRLEFWAAATEMIRDYPLGSGGNSFSEGRGWSYLRTEERDRTTRAIHNGFLTEITDWGVQGMALMTLFLLAVWRTLQRGRRLAMQAGDTNAVLTYACIGASLMAWLVSSIFGDYLNDEWGFWAMALSYAYLRVRTLAAATQPATQSQTVGAAAAMWSPAMPRGATQ